MPKLDDAKWHEFRKLYECHFVSLEMIARLGKVQLQTARNIAEKYSWRFPEHTANRLRFRLAEEVLDHLESLKTAGVDEAIQDQLVQGMQLTAKTLE